MALNEVAAIQICNCHVQLLRGIEFVMDGGLIW